jgi:hypothetical protein
LIAPSALRATLTREPDFAGTLAGAFPRCASASLNDNFLDICFRQKFAPNAVQSVPAERTGMKTLDVRIIDVENASDTGNTSDHIEAPRRARDRDQHEGVLDLLDLDNDVTLIPHIRDPRTED